MPTVGFRVEERVREATAAAVKQIAESNDAINAAVVGRQTGSRLLLNSSFIFRDSRSLRTNQSSRRLVARLASKGKHVAVEDVAVVDDRLIRDSYKLLTVQDNFASKPLSDAVDEEIRSAGDLLLVLVGKMKGLRPSTQSVNANTITQLRLDPLLKTQIEKTDSQTYTVAALVPMEDLLGKIDSDFRNEGGLSTGERIKIAESYDKLLDAATADVAIPTTRIQDADVTILGKIVEAIRSQVKEYRRALDALIAAPEDRHALHEVLRIAYNFSSDVVPLLFLFVSICDLKPLVFWCTVDAQWAFRAALGELPWLALGRKEKLEEYRAVISRARDHAFHHILPFDATLEVDLSNSDVRAERIRLFTPYGTRDDRGIHLKDQALIDVFAEFSRSRQRPVSLAFWRANLKVMDAASTLGRQILETLILIHEARRVKTDG
jgi:hypothetical protein